jgi:hypothetical protein
VVGVETVVVFFGALAGAVLGAYGGVTIERLRGQHEVALERREDIKRGLLAINQHAAVALRICVDLRTAGHWPTLYGDDWRPLRAKQLSGEATDMLVALAQVELFLADTRTIRQRANEYFDILTAADDEDEPASSRLTRVAAAHTALTRALREELERADARSDWAGATRRVLSPLSRLASRLRASEHSDHKTDRGA